MVAVVLRGTLLGSQLGVGGWSVDPFARADWGRPGRARRGFRRVLLVPYLSIGT